MAMSISESIIAALKLFNEFTTHIKTSEAQIVEGLSVSGWYDELGRLRIWAANIGAHHVNQTSLDFRLRDASHVRGQIVKLLERLIQRLGDAKDILEEASDENQDTISSSGSDEEYLESEIIVMQKSVSTIIKCLFQMSMLVRKPAQRDLRKGVDQSEIAHYKQYDYNHVRDKFPKADNNIVVRLGDAITRRRGYLKYRERHAAKLKQGLESVASADDEVKQDGLASCLSETIATDSEQSNIDFDDRASDSGVSQTSYAPTLRGGGDISIPPPPRESHNGDPFECPICFHIISINASRSWHKHVFRDLEPYVCTNPDCMTQQRLFGARHDWLQHTNHFHSGNFSAPNDTRADFYPCPLCGSVSRTQQLLMKHLARHLEELALFVLPISQNEELDNSSDSIGSESTAMLSISKWSNLEAIGSAEKSPDTIAVKHKVRSHLLDFPASAIHDGTVYISDLRHRTARNIGCDDPQRVKLLYKGRILKDDSKACVQEGLKDHSEILAIFSEDSVDKIRAKLDSNNLDSNVRTYMDSGDKFKETELDRLAKKIERLKRVNNCTAWEASDLNRLASEVQRMKRDFRSTDADLDRLDTKVRVMEFGFRSAGRYSG